MPKINSYRATILRPDGEVFTQRILALSITDAQHEVERLLAAHEYQSITVECMH